MDIHVETVGPFQENCYFLTEPRSRETIVVDPGDEGDHLLAECRARDLRVVRILGTHGHLDHVGAVAQLRRATGAPFHLHERDRSLVQRLPVQAALFGLPIPEVPDIDGSLVEGDIIEFGNPVLRLRVVETAGHTPGGVSLLADGVAFVGDCLFLGSVGRTDLPGGDGEQLLRSIREKLLTLDDATRVLSGHGPETTIGREREWNPYLGAVLE